jgi:hypothetical protein
MIVVARQCNYSTSGFILEMRGLRIHDRRRHHLLNENVLPTHDVRLEDYDWSAVARSSSISKTLQLTVGLA